MEGRNMFGAREPLDVKGRCQSNVDHSIVNASAEPFVHERQVVRNGVRIGPLTRIVSTAFVPPFEREDREYQRTAGEGVGVLGAVRVARETRRSCPSTSSVSLGLIEFELG